MQEQRTDKYNIYVVAEDTEAENHATDYKTIT
jgi:hypothetical protein